MSDNASGNGAIPKRAIGPSRDDEYYPPISDNRYKGLVYWWTFGELRADPEQLTRFVSTW